MEITLVIIQALSSEQASQEERVNCYRYDLQQTHQVEPKVLNQGPNSQILS